LRSIRVLTSSRSSIDVALGSFGSGKAMAGLSRDGSVT
jgi:hypothetical protein